MDARHAVLLAVSEEGSGTLVGRTLLQKKLFFASLLVGEDLNFRPHYYGPYSQEVADATDSQVINRFLDEQIEVFPDSNIFGERRRHSYRITADGEQLLASIEREASTEVWQEALRQINSHPVAADFNLLSIAAKVRTILSDLGGATADEISRRAPAYGWRIPHQQIEKVVEFLEHLELIEQHQG